MFTSEQVEAWRAEWARRCEALRETRSVRRMAKDAGVNYTAMRMILDGETYKWVR
jgi:hypothetical protein